MFESVSGAISRRIALGATQRSVLGVTYIDGGKSVKLRHYPKSQSPPFKARETERRWPLCPRVSNRSFVSVRYARMHERGPEV